MAVNEAVGNDGCSFGRDDSVGDWRHLLIDARSQPAEHEKRRNEDECEQQPECSHDKFVLWSVLLRCERWHDQVAPHQDGGQTAGNVGRKQAPANLFQTAISSAATRGTPKIA
jgi:hypothetical protein